MFVGVAFSLGWFLRPSLERADKRSDRLNNLEENESANQKASDARHDLPNQCALIWLHSPVLAVSRSTCT